MVYYISSSDMDQYYLEAILAPDMLLLAGTLMSVWALMVYQTGSIWLASWGLAMIFLNLPALILYRWISQLAYFGTLNVLGMFIILSIGADDIFNN